MPVPTPVPPPEDLKLLVKNKEEHKPYMKQRRPNETVCTNNSDKNKLLNRYPKNGGKVEKKFTRSNNNPQLANNQFNRSNMRYAKNHVSNVHQKPVPLMSLMDIPLTVPAKLVQAREGNEQTNPNSSNQSIPSNSNQTGSLQNSDVNNLQIRDQQNYVMKTINNPNVFKPPSNKNFNETRNTSPSERSINSNSVIPNCSNSTSISAPPKLINNGVKTDPKSHIKNLDNSKFQTNSKDCFVKKEIKPNSAAAAALEIANRSNTKNSGNASTKTSTNSNSSAVQLPDCSKPPPSFSSAQVSDKESIENVSSRLPNLPINSIVNQYQPFIPPPIYPYDPFSAAYSSYWAQWQTQYWQWASMNQMTLAQKLNSSTESNPATKPS